MVIKPISEYVKRRKYETNKGDNKKGFQAYNEGHCVYVLSEGGDGCRKIGRSSNLWRRLEKYTVSSPREIKIEGVLFVGSLDESVKLEKYFHNHFKKAGRHVKGEWFIATSGDLREAALTALIETGIRTTKAIGCFLTDQSSEDAVPKYESLPDFCDHKEKRRPSGRGSRGNGIGWARVW